MSELSELSDLFDEYPMLIFVVQALLATTLIIGSLVWAMSSGGKKQTPIDDRQERVDRRDVAQSLRQRPTSLNAVCAASAA
jgi:hypothetical protein